MSSQADLRELIERIRGGSETATQEFVSRYGTHILRIVRHRLNRALRPKFDSQDFVQAVWASFFALLPGQFRFEGPDALVAFLTELAQNKVVEVVRERLVYQKYNVKREQPLGADLSQIADRYDQPKPDDIAMAREEWQRFFENQPEQHRQIIVMLSSGQTRQEVAEAMGVSEKTVHRVVQRLAPKVVHE